VTGQVAICTLLLLCMGLFLRSLQASYQSDLGFDPRGITLLAFDPGLDHRPDVESKQLLRNILDRARSVPGVEVATYSTAVPLTFIISNSRFVPAERAPDPSAQRVRSDIYAVGPRYFTAMGIPFLSGDDFSDRGAGRSVAIVNDAFARAAFPNQSPLGRRILGDGKALDIIGVVGTTRSRTVGEDPRPIIYLPILDAYAAAEYPRGVTLVVKSRSAAAGPIRETIRSVEPSLAVFDVRTMDSQLDDALIVSRLTWILSALAGSVGLALATIGVYAAVSFAVARRRRELGIRLAIGARPREIQLLVARQGILSVVLGTSIGVCAALFASRYAATLLFGVGPVDPVTFIVAPVFLVAVGFIAGLVPARAAARLDPISVLRID
jgi:predicted permease